MTRHRLTWLKGRFTPVVSSIGHDNHRIADGRIVASRIATLDEEQQITRGEWVRARAPEQVSDARPRPLYVSRKLTNGEDVQDFYRKQGVTGLVPVDEMHVTLTYSTAPVDWMKMGSAWSEKIEVVAGGPRDHELFGTTQDALVLRFTNWEIEHRHQHMRESGASYDWPEYSPHVTIAYGSDFDLESLTPFNGKMNFGPEVFAEIKTDWKERLAQKLEDGRSFLWAME